MGRFIPGHAGGLQETVVGPNYEILQFPGKKQRKQPQERPEEPER